MGLRAVVSSLVLCVYSCGAAAPCFADEQPWTLPAVTPVQKGAPAPFSGVLLTPEAVAKIVADAREREERAKVDVDDARAVQKAEDNKVLADAKADAELQRKTMQAGIDRRDNQISSLTKSLEAASSSSRSPWLWMGVGAVGGFLLSGTLVVLVSGLKR